MDPEVERYLAALVAEARAVLGEELVGAYAAGSVALDAYEPGRSDIDVALVCRSFLPTDVKQELVKSLRHEALACPARGLELVVYRRDVAGSGTADPAFELELNTGEAMPFRVTLRPEDRPEEDGLFWYAVDRSILRQSGLALVGPAAPETFADPAPTDLRNLLVTSLHWWMARSTDSGDGPSPTAAEAVLGACRALKWHRSARWLSKVEAGRSLLEDGYQPAEPIERALGARTGGPPPSGRDARAFQQRVLDEISTGYG